MPRKALDEQAKDENALVMRDRESLARPVPLTTDGESLLPLGGGGGPRSKALALANAGIEFSTPGGRSYHAKTWLISRVLCV